MLKERKLRAIKRTLGEPAFLKGDEAIFVCPRERCRKDRAKLSVNLITERFHCWICDWGAGKASLLPLMLRNSDEWREYYAELQDRHGLKVETPVKTYEKPVLPAEFKTLTMRSSSLYYRQAMEYLSRRGVSADDIWQYKLGYCDSGWFKNRIVIPSFDAEGELNFFTARTWYDGPRKYDHGDFDKNIIFNEYMVDWRKPVTLTEGPFDAIKAGANAIPLQTSHLREDSKLFERIVSSGVDVYFALDTDAFQKQLKIIGSFLRYGTNCFHVQLGNYDDAGEMTKEEFAKAKSRAYHVKSELDILRLRVCA